MWITLCYISIVELHIMKKYNIFYFSLSIFHSLVHNEKIANFHQLIHTNFMLPTIANIPNKVLIWFIQLSFGTLNSSPY